LKNFYKLELLTFFSRVRDTEGDLLSYDEVVVKFLVPNNASFINYVKLISAIPNNWIFDNDSNSNSYAKDFISFKEQIRQQIFALGKSNKVVYNYLKERNKVFAS